MLSTKQPFEFLVKLNSSAVLPPHIPQKYSYKTDFCCYIIVNYALTGKYEFCKAKVCWKME